MNKKQEKINFGKLFFWLLYASMSHSSYTDSKGLTNAIGERAKANYIRIAELIRAHGTPNAQFPTDKDLVFADLRAKFDVGGLGSILKNMKAKVKIMLMTQWEEEV